MGISVDREKIVLRKHVSRIVIPSEAEGSFSLAVRGSASDSEKRETPYRGKTVGGASYKRLSEGGGKGGTKKISRCARNDSVGNGYPVHPAKAVPGKHSSRIVIGSEACPQSHLSIYFHSTPCISNNYLFFQFGIF